MLQHLFGDDDGILPVGAVLANVEIGEIDRGVVEHIVFQ